jgi:hypothetical protein
VGVREVPPCHQGEADAGYNVSHLPPGSDPPLSQSQTRTEIVGRCHPGQARILRKAVAPINAWIGPGLDGALFEDPEPSVVERAMASVTGETAPEGPFYYREHRINLFEQPPGGPRKGKWMVWLNLDETHAWQVDELSLGLEKAKATIDDFLEGADD